MTAVATQPMIRASALSGLREAFASKGLEYDHLLAEAGIGSGPFNPDDAIPLNAYAQMLARASELSSESCLGLYLASRFPIGGTGILGYLLLNAPNVRRSVECLIRYLRVQVDAVEIDYVEEHGIGWLTYSYKDAFTAPRRVFTEFALALIVFRMKLLVGSDWSPLSVEFEYRQPECHEKYKELFGPRLEYGRPLSRIAINSSALYTRIPEADAQLFEILRKAADREMLELKEPGDIVATVRQAIIEGLPQGDADLDKVAAACQLQPRQLQWRLSQASTTFEAELNGVRHRMAERYLRDTDESITEIAFLLGFSEVSAFTRAAHRWFGMPPSGFRTKLRQA